MIVGTPSLRVRDDYFVIATFAFQIIIFSIMNNWVSLTGGPMGLPGVPAPTIFNWYIDSQTDFLILVSLLCFLSVEFSLKIGHSPFGRVLKAIREDEILPQDVKPLLLVKLQHRVLADATGKYWVVRCEVLDNYVRAVPVFPQETGRPVRV